MTTSYCQLYNERRTPVEQVQSPVVVKTYKLYIHTIQFCTEDLVIRSEDFPDVQPGDILEIYHEEETFSRLLLQHAQQVSG